LYNQTNNSDCIGPCSNWIVFSEHWIKCKCERVSCLLIVSGSEECGGNLLTDKKQLRHQWILNQYSRQHLLSIDTYNQRWWVVLSQTPSGVWQRRSRPDMAGWMVYMAQRESSPPPSQTVPVHNIYYRDQVLSIMRGGIETSEFPTLIKWSTQTDHNVCLLLSGHGDIRLFCTYTALPTEKRMCNTLQH